MFQTYVVGKIKTHILCSKTFFPKIVFVYEIMWKQNSAGGQATVHLRCMLDIYGYRHTLTIRNSYCSSTTTVVARKRHSVSFILTLPKLNSVALVRTRTIPTPVGEVSAKFADRGVSRGQRNGSPQPLISVF